jgi:hypothetical protein
VNAESPKKLVSDDNDKDSEAIEIKDLEDDEDDEDLAEDEDSEVELFDYSDGAEKVIEVMVSNKNNAHIQEQACDRLRSLSDNDGRSRYRK